MLGKAGIVIISLLVALATFGAVHSSLFTAARSVYVGCVCIYSHVFATVHILRGRSRREGDKGAVVPPPPHTHTFQVEGTEPLHFCAIVSVNWTSLKLTCKSTITEN